MVNEKQRKGCRVTVWIACYSCCIANTTGVITINAVDVIVSNDSPRSDVLEKVSILYLKECDESFQCAHVSIYVR